MARDPVSWILSYVNATITKQYFAENGDRLNSQITQLLHEMHFTNTFHDQNLYICFQNEIVRHVKLCCNNLE